MAGTKESGRRTLRDEMTVLKRFEQLSPLVFAYVQKCLKSGSKEDERWAMDWLKTGYAKMIPQKIGGNPDDRTPIPLLYVLNNNSNKEDSKDESQNTGSTGGNVSQQNNIDTNLFNSIIPER